MGELLHLVLRGLSGGHSPPRPLLAVPNVTAYPSTASVPITVLLYNGPLLCGFVCEIWSQKLESLGYTWRLKPYDPAVISFNALHYQHVTDRRTNTLPMAVATQMYNRRQNKTDHIFNIINNHFWVMSQVTYIIRHAKQPQKSKKITRNLASASYKRHERNSDLA